MAARRSPASGAIAIVLSAPPRCGAALVVIAGSESGKMAARRIASASSAGSTEGRRNSPPDPGAAPAPSRSRLGDRYWRGCASSLPADLLRPCSRLSETCRASPRLRERARFCAAFRSPPPSRLTGDDAERRRSLPCRAARGAVARAFPSSDRNGTRNVKRWFCGQRKQPVSGGFTPYAPLQRRVVRRTSAPLGNELAPPTSRNRQEQGESALRPLPVFASGGFVVRWLPVRLRPAAPGRVLLRFRLSPRSRLRCELGRWVRYAV